MNLDQAIIPEFLWSNCRQFSKDSSTQKLHTVDNTHLFRPKRMLPLFLAEQCLRKKNPCPGDDFMKSTK